MDAQLVAMLGQTIYVATAAATRDSQGQPTWGTPASRTVRVELNSEIIPGPNGEELRTTHKIFTTAPIGLMDRLWMPGDSSGTASLARRILRVLPIPGEVSSTIDHYEVDV